MNNMNIEKTDIMSIIAVLGGSIVTWYMNNELVISGYDMNAVVASGIVGLVGGILFRKVAGQIFCGSFVGMSSSLTIESIYASILFGLVAGLIFVAWKNYLNGHGGKFGTTAFMSVCFCMMLLRLGGNDYSGVSGSGSVLTMEWFLVVLLSGILGAVATYIVRVGFFNKIITYKCAEAVFGSAFVGLVVGLVLPEISTTYGLTSALVVYSASFAGMTAIPKIFDSWKHFASAGVFVAILFTATVDLVPGGGGKLGTIGFTSVIITKYILEHYRERRKELCPA